MALTPRRVGVAEGWQAEASSDARRILHKLRALTTDNRAIPAAARNLLFFFLRPFTPLTLRPVFPPSLCTPPCHPPPTLLLLLHDFPFFAFRLVRQGASSGTRGRHVSARVGVACTRRHASSSTFVASPALHRPISRSSPFLSRGPPLVFRHRCRRRRHLSFASLLISKRSCRWWSRNFRESFLQAPFLSSVPPPSFIPRASHRPFLLSHLRSSHPSAPKKRGRRCQLDEERRRVDWPDGEGRGATQVACVRGIPLPLLSRLARSWRIDQCAFEKG